MDVDIFNTAGTHTWTCPADVHLVRVQCWGTGGNGDLGPANTSGGGGGGGAYSELVVDVTPGNDYDVVITNPDEAPHAAYFKSLDTVSARNGASASGTSGGAGGSRSLSVGIAYGGGSGADGSGSLGGGGGSSADASENGVNGSLPAGGNAPGLGGNGGNGGNLAGTSDGSSGQAPGGGGGGAAGGDTPDAVPGSGALGKVQITWQAGQAGNGGGGGGGYARSTISVTPGNEYDLYIGHGGDGQKLTFGDDFSGDEEFRARINGESSWFQSDATIKGAGGQSAGSEDGVDEEALTQGALGGGRPGNPEQNIGDVTHVGGNGGDGVLFHQSYQYIGGGGGAAASDIGAGDTGDSGAAGGFGGWSRHRPANYEHFFPITIITNITGNSIVRCGNGGMGNENSGFTSNNLIHGSSPGGGGGGSDFQPDINSSGELYSSNSGEAGAGAPGRVLIRGTCTSRRLVPGF